MSEISGETTMEDILASIKKIIADDGAATPRTFRKPAIPESVMPLTDRVRTEDVLDLTSPVADPVPVTETIISPQAESATRHALDALAAAAAPAAPVTVARGATVEDLASELLRPMLKDWLDAHLPAIVERLVAQEVARISGRG
jgi:cell pole-organizing protein PopZ